MTKKVLMIVLDGFSSRYVNSQLSPNLHFMKQTGYLANLKSMFGFQGIGAAMYSGASSNATGIFTEFVFKRNEFISKSLVLPVLLKLSDLLPRDNLCSNARALLFKFMRFRNAGISNLIPPQVLSQFSPKLKTNFTCYGSLREVKTVFDVLHEHSRSFELKKPPPRLEESSIKRAINQIKSGTLPDLSIIHPCSLDMLGHDFGPTSTQVEEDVFCMDSQIGRVFKCVESSYDKIMVLVLSDHGMVPVRRSVNMKHILSGLPLKLGKDYLVFLDSTVARFWFFNDKAKVLITEKLVDVNAGRILSTQDKKVLGVDKIGEEYGELIFAVGEGDVIFPDYFRKRAPPKGMHGYALQNHDNPIIGLHHPERLKLNPERTPKFVDIAPTILDFLKLPVPSNCEGASLVK